MISNINTNIPKVSTLPQVISSVPPKVPGDTKSKLPTKPKNISMSVARYRKAKMRVKYYELKKLVMGNLTKGEEFLLNRFKGRLKKLRKIAAPELIRDLMKRKASRGKGKRRGSDLSKLMSKPTK